MAVVRIRLREVLLVLSVIVLLSWDVLLGVFMATKLNMNDFGKFYYSARLFLSGADMYQPTPATWIPVSPSTSGPFLDMNPPHVHVPFLFLARLSPAWALAIWGVVNGVCMVLAFDLIRRELNADVFGSFRARLRTIATFLGCAATGAVIITGQLAFAIMLPMTLAWLAARRGRWRSAGVYLGVLMSVKAFLLIFIPYLLIRRKTDALAAALASFVACFTAGFIVFGVGPHRAWLQTLGSVDWTWAPMNGSLAGLLNRALAPTPLFTPMLVTAPSVRTSIWLVGATIVAAVTFLVVWRDTSSASIDRAFALLLLAALLISPLGWIYYLWLALGPIGAFLTSPRRGATALGGSATRLLRGAVVLLFVPVALTVVLQPNAAATALLGSVYFWAILAMWVALTLDSRRPTADGAAWTPHCP